METQQESTLILLTELQKEFEEASENRKQWLTIIDEEGNTEIFLKYQGTTIFSILEKEVAPENLCRTLLTMAKYRGTLTINYLNLPYQTVLTISSSHLT